MTKSVRVKLSGGLGNQLFKTLAALQFARQHNANVEIDLSWFRNYKRLSPKVSRRSFALDYFAKLIKESSIKSFGEFSDLPYDIGRSLRKINKRIAANMGFVSESNISKTKSFFGIKAYLDGNFENWHLLPSDDELKNLLEFPLQGSMWFESTQKDLIHSDFIALHVRQGDYLSLPEIYNVLSPKYYSSSLDFLYESLGNLRVILFSDDPKSALKWLGNDISVDKVIDANDEVHPAEILRAMSMGRGIVTAHSTFSWWGAKLGTINGNTKSVTIPSRFFVDNTIYNNLRLPDWQVIDV